MYNIVFREDPLAELKTASTYQEKLAVVHEVLKKRCPGIDVSHFSGFTLHRKSPQELRSRFGGRLCPAQDCFGRDTAHCQ
jgi:hypothetical protein